MFGSATATGAPTSTNSSAVEPAFGSSDLKDFARRWFPDLQRCYHGNTYRAVESVRCVYNDPAAKYIAVEFTLFNDGDDMDARLRSDCLRAAQSTNPPKYPDARPPEVNIGAGPGAGRYCEAGKGLSGDPTDFPELGADGEGIQLVIWWEDPAKMISGKLTWEADNPPSGTWTLLRQIYSDHVR